ncbi:MAG: PD40 domain-containing protein [Geodermatophilaceae bacterium]|nr:PD40 domain-containing protein [Geodermatophilaceae bacterium]
MTRQKVVATGDDGASYSPDGTHIVFARTPGVGPAGNADIYTMTVDGDDVQLVPTGPLWESRPDWGSAG